MKEEKRACLLQVYVRDIDCKAGVFITEQALNIFLRVF